MEGPDGAPRQGSGRTGEGVGKTSASSGPKQSLCLLLGSVQSCSLLPATVCAGSVPPGPGLGFRPPAGHALLLCAFTHWCLQPGSIPCPGPHGDSRLPPLSTVRVPPRPVRVSGTLSSSGVTPLGSHIPRLPARLSPLVMQRQGFNGWTLEGRSEQPIWRGAHCPSRFLGDLCQTTPLLCPWKPFISGEGSEHQGSASRASAASRGCPPPCRSAPQFCLYVAVTISYVSICLIYIRHRHISVSVSVSSMPNLFFQ